MPGPRKHDSQSPDDPAVARTELNIAHRLTSSRAADKRNIILSASLSLPHPFLPPSNRTNDVFDIDAGGSAFSVIASIGAGAKEDELNCDGKRIERQSRYNESCCSYGFLMPPIMIITIMNTWKSNDNQLFARVFWICIGFGLSPVP